MLFGQGVFTMAGNTVTINYNMENRGIGKIDK